jgi:hypothetical protein
MFLALVARAAAVSCAASATRGCVAFRAGAAPGRRWRALPQGRASRHGRCCRRDRESELRRSRSAPVGCEDPAGQASDPVRQAETLRFRDAKPRGRRLRQPALSRVAVHIASHARSLRPGALAVATGGRLRRLAARRRLEQEAPRARSPGDLLAPLRSAKCQVRRLASHTLKHSEPAGPGSPPTLLRRAERDRQRAGVAQQQYGRLRLRVDRHLVTGRGVWDCQLWRFKAGGGRTRREPDAVAVGESPR